MKTLIEQSIAECNNAANNDGTEPATQALLDAATRLEKIKELANAPLPFDTIQVPGYEPEIYSAGFKELQSKLKELL